MILSGSTETEQYYKNKTKETIPFSTSSPTAKADTYQNHGKKENYLFFI